MQEQEVKTFEIRKKVTPMGNEVRWECDEIALYTGEVKEGMDEVPHGKGKCVWKEEKDSYEGDWVDGSMQGYGIYDAGSAYDLPFGDHWTYEGEFKDDMFHGHGIQKSQKEGWVYEGEWARGMREGVGVLTEERGIVYRGTWVKGSLNGHGICENPLFGFVYEGNFAYGRFDGYGVKTMNGGAKYEGEFVRGRQWGKGVFTCEDYTWDGEWEQDHIKGKGVYTSKEGWVFTGEWHGSYGSGKIVFPNGDIYEGEMSAKGIYHPISQLCMHGKGVYTYADGSVYDGKFEYGERFDKYMEKVRAEDAIKEEKRRKEAEIRRAEKRKELTQKRKKLTKKDFELRARLEEKCKVIYGEETDIKKRYEILQRAFYAAHNSNYNDAMAWELAMGGSPRTQFWQEAIDLKWEVEKLCEYYEIEVELGEE